MLTPFPKLTRIRWSVHCCTAAPRHHVFILLPFLSDQVSRDTGAAAALARLVMQNGNTLRGVRSFGGRLVFDDGSI